MIPDKLHTIFFDFDGVLADSTTIKTDAFRELFKAYGPSAVDAIVEYHLLHGGISRVDKIRYCYEEILKIPLSAAEQQNLAEQFSGIVLDKVISSDWIGGAREFLEKAYKAVRIIVISGTPDEELKLVLSKRHMDHYFTDIVGSPVKKPEHISNFLIKYDLKPQNCLFVGDALTDYNAAIGADLHFIGIQQDITFPSGTVVLPDCAGLADEIQNIFQ